MDDLIYKKGDFPSCKSYNIKFNRCHGHPHGEAKVHLPPPLEIKMSRILFA